MWSGQNGECLSSSLGDKAYHSNDFAEDGKSSKEKWRMKLTRTKSDVREFAQVS